MYALKFMSRPGGEWFEILPTYDCYRKCAVVLIALHIHSSVHNPSRTRQSSGWS